MSILSRHANITEHPDLRISQIYTLLSTDSASEQMLYCTLPPLLQQTQQCNLLQPQVLTQISFQVMRYENVNVKENDSSDPATLSPSNPREKWLRKRTHVKLRVCITPTRLVTDLIWKPLTWHPALLTKVWLIPNDRLQENWKTKISQGQTVCGARKFVLATTFVVGGLRVWRYWWLPSFCLSCCRMLAFWSRREVLLCTFLGTSRGPMQRGPFHPADAVSLFLRFQEGAVTSGYHFFYLAFQGQKLKQFTYCLLPRSQVTGGISTLVSSDLVTCPSFKLNLRYKEVHITCLPPRVLCELVSRLLWRA